MMINFTGISPVRALFVTAVINGILAPPLLVLVMIVSNNRKIMGSRMNSGALNTLGWITAFIMMAAAVALAVVGA